jgi:hypothetical protein
MARADMKKKRIFARPNAALFFKTYTVGRQGTENFNAL